MSLRCDLHRRAHTLHPLALGLLFVLGIAPGSATARDLTGDHEEITAADPAEEWRLFSEASLRVTGGSTLNILADGNSVVELDGATVTRGDSSADEVVSLWNRSSLVARDSRIIEGTLYLRHDSSAELINSELRLESPSGSYNRPWVGIELDALSAGNSRLLLDGSAVVVGDRPNNPSDNSGIGIRMGGGEVTLRGGSRINAANVGVRILGSGPDGLPRVLRVDDSTIRAGRGPAIDVDVSTQRADPVHLYIANGSTLEGGNGDVLRVTSSNDQSTMTRLEIDDSRLKGNVMLFAPGNQNLLEVLLTNNARIEGRFVRVSHARIESNSTWALTTSSLIGHLDLGNTGTVELGRGVEDLVFNTLSLERFTGDGGMLVFNTVLDGDDARSDKVEITGDANGHARVLVRNAGGQGAQTVDGIELISIGGASNAQFELIGRAVGGQYEYFLRQGADGNWYLRSQLPVDPEHPCVTDPTLPECEVTLPVEPSDPTDPTDPTEPTDPTDPTDPADPVDPVNPVDPPHPEPVLRPETGAYLANQRAMDQLLQHSAQTRMRLHREPEGVRTWAATGVSESRQKASGHQSLESTLSRVQIGADLGVFDDGHGRVGAMLGAGKADAASRSTVTGYRAEGSVKGGSVGVYGQWSNDALYVDASVQHGRFSNEVQGEGLAAERYDTRLWQGAIEAGYTFALGRVGGMTLSLQPQLQLTYTDAAMDAHVESNGTVVRSTGSDGLGTRVGVHLQGEAVIGRLQLAPYVAVNAYADSRRAGMVFDGETVTGGTPRQRTGLSAGTQLRFNRRLSAWGDVTASQGEHDHREFGARIAAAWRW